MPALEVGLNPATWMLQVSTPGMESAIGVDFGQIYRDSSLYEYVTSPLFAARQHTPCSQHLCLGVWLTIDWRLLVSCVGLMRAIVVVHSACSASQSLWSEVAHRGHSEGKIPSTGDSRGLWLQGE